MFTLIVFLPLLGAIIAGFFGRRIGDEASMYVTSGALVLSALLSLIAFFSVPGSETETVRLFTWMAAGDLAVDWALRIDTLTSVMLVVVTGVSSLVHIYSIGYMSHDPHRARFFAYLSLFTFAMLMLVTADNLVQMFFGWEGVGLASYLLIGFWYRKPEANAAAIKAFVVNRVGDFGFALGIFALFMMVGSVEFDVIFAASPELVQVSFNFLGYEVNAITSICILLFIGAMGKSAQLGLHTWLPDAMEGPTPVSALIHAATMVTAGVFLVCRMSPLFELASGALALVTFVGAATAFFAATVGLVQNDIKRVIAYSTCSQLGYMFFAAGIGAYQAAMFHLFTHAFFKALLFLCAGSVIHALHGEQDMRRMGGMRHVIPQTFWLMVIGTVALTGLGIPGTPIGFAGFFSKDIIIEASFTSTLTGHEFTFWVGVIGAGITAFYSWRLIWMTFFGEHCGDAETMAHAHESPRVMLVPLYILAAGAIFAGVLFSGSFVGDRQSDYWNGAIVGTGHAVGTEAAVGDHATSEVPKQDDGHAVAENEGHDEAKDDGHGAADEHHGIGVLAAAHNVPLWVKFAPFVVSVLGLFLSYYFYVMNPEARHRAISENGLVYRFLLNKWYFDELYDLIFVQNARRIGRLFWKGGDGKIIDGTIDGLSMKIVPFFTARVVKLQSGYVYHYAFAMLIGITGLISFFLVGNWGA